MATYSWFRAGHVAPTTCNGPLLALRHRIVGDRAELTQVCDNTVALGCLHGDIITTMKSQTKTERVGVVIHEALHVLANCTYGDSDHFHLTPGVWRLRADEWSVEARAAQLLP